ncbi:MAG: MerR family transcriptional regulator [Dorea sp.]|uniref:MerR family transcriptional regulator n=1 Tax=Dorea sp. YH-dor226 TaxID=3151119 RepID=UPI00304BB9D3|nr:MerR family transcriptional regulator [Dorea sp.]
MKMKKEHSCFPEKESSYLYRIGMFAQMNHVTIKTLRFYEEQGLLLPASVDKENGYRYYTMDQMAVLHRITAWKQAGFTIEDIRRLNDSPDSVSFLHRKKAEIMSKIAELTMQMAMIDGYLSGGEEGLQSPVLIRTVPSVVVAGMQERVKTYDALFDLMPSLGARMEELGCECALPEYCFTRYLEPGYQEEQILIEVCQAVTEKKEDTDDVKFKELPEIEAACIYHRGSYNEFSRSYAAVLRYIEENGYEICGDIREKYIDGVWNKDTEEEWLSEIQIPVKRAGGTDED